MENKKGNIAVIVFIVVVVAITAGIIGWLFAKKSQAPAIQPITQTQPAVQSVTPVTQLKQEGIIYKNDEYAFQVTIPKSWMNYTVEKQALTDKESLSGKLGEVILVFNYPFDNPIPRVEGDKSMGTLDKDWLWGIRIIPIASWKSDLCGNTPLCIQGKVLAKNSQYVFEDIGHSNIGAGQFCIEQPQKLQVFCGVRNDFDESKINFQLLKQ